MQLSPLEALILKAYALDDWSVALETFLGYEDELRWYGLVDKIVEHGLLEPLWLYSFAEWFPPLQTQRLTPAGWDAIDEHCGDVS